ncbi:MAG TPA: stage II sporulation protein M [Steroidobacteraceae bacterium]|nr:stage II sporulation protein M [Steroidobacteraceae bacterium]
MNAAAADARALALAQPAAIAVPSATGVEARVVLAGPAARSLAFVLDWLIRTSLSVVYLLAAALLIFGDLDFNVTSERETLWYLAGVIPSLAIYFLYHMVLEPLMSGRTPGKRMIGLRVLTPEGLVPGVGALITRNVFRLVDSMPVLYVVGLLATMLGKRHLRIGDLAAGTVLAVERAPFFEKLAAKRSGESPDAGWFDVRRRAAALKRRRHPEVHDALGVVDDYRAMARAVGSARIAGASLAPQAELAEATYADLHDVIHRPASRAWLSLWSLFRDRVPAILRKMRVHLMAVTLLFVASAIVGWWLVYTYPDLIQMFASESLIATVERGELWTEGILHVVPAPELSVSILTNNIVVSLFCFCSGLVFGLGTFYMVGLNGLSLGALFAFTAQHDLAGKLFDFVTAHGCVELSCICIAGAAGAYMGEALIRPRSRTRSEAFRIAAREAVQVMVVVVLLLFVCGFIEGYVSPDPEVPRWARVTIGLGYWFFMVSLLRGYVFGRSRGGEAVPA